MNELKRKLVEKAIVFNGINLDLLSDILSIHDPLYLMTLLMVLHIVYVTHCIDVRKMQRVNTKPLVMM